MFFLSSHISQPTRHLQVTPLQPFLHFLDPSFSASVPLRYLPTIPTLNTFVPLTLWSASYSPLFIGKTHPSNESSGSFGGGLGSATSLGVPTRLKDWIRGYPAMLPEPATRSRKQDRLQPRRGARTVRVVSVRRNVRMYTPDLVKMAASSATRPPSGLTHTPNVFIQASHRPMRRPLPLPQYQHSEMAGLTMVWENQLSREKSDSGV